MSQALQFTLDQAATQLDLSESVVKRLSQYYQIPKRYYTLPKGQPRILLYDSREIELLREIQKLLVAGNSLTEIKKLITQKQDSIEAELTDTSTNTEPDDSADDNLVEYDQNEALKEQLAQTTFKQYRQNNTPPKAPFMSLVKTLQTKGVKPATTKSKKMPQYQPPQILQGLENAWQFHAPEMSFDLKQRVLALQQEMMHQIP